jgi:hypothetical protein
MSAQAVAPYPLHVDAELDQPSRWLWLVKWVLAIPHAIVLAFLWVAYMVLTMVAFFAIIFTGRYPRSIFEFNVGVLRWTWRVSYYTYNALGTDRYPPFTLDERPDYPAHLAVDYPEHLSRGLVLVKWWLLAIPHYVIVGLLAGGAWFATANGVHIGGGLIGILVLVAAVMLAVTGTYPRALFDLILGLNRWVLRVAAYAGLMTDVYPPFRLDVGGSDGTGTLTVPPPTAGAAPDAARPGWTGGRITALVIGALLAIGSFAPIAAGITGIVFDRTQRDADGFVHTGMHTFESSGYALMSEGVDLRFDNQPALRVAQEFIGDARIRVRSQQAVFAGVALTADAEAYLRDVDRTIVSDINRTTATTTRPGGPPIGAPGAQRFWTASTEGSGTRSLAVPIENGNFTLVVMNADGSSGVRAAVSLGATAPNLGWMSVVALIVGAMLLAGAVALMIVPIVKASKP